MRHSTHLRCRAKGGALIAALFFMIVVTIAGASLLQSSTLNQLAIIERSIDVRLMIAVEAGLESTCGRFRLVEGVQDDWSWMAASTRSSPYDLGTQTVNGIEVHLTCWPVGSPSVPLCTVRGGASVSGSTRYVELDLRIASFSDYSMYLGEGGQSHWGAIEIHGRFHSNSDAHFNSANTKFHLVPSFGMNGGAWADTHNNTGRPESETGEGYMNFDPHVNADVVIPANVVVYSGVQQAAKQSRTNPHSTSNDHYYYENTLEIQFLGNGSYRRTFVRRNSNTVGSQVPPGWVMSSGSTVDGSSNIVTNDPDLTGVYRAINNGLAATDAWLDNGGLTNSSGIGGAKYDRTGLNIKGAPQNWFTSTGGSTFGVVSGHWSVDNQWYDLCWEEVAMPTEGAIYVVIGSPDIYGSSDDSLGPANKFTQHHVDFGDTSLNNPTNRNDTGRTPILLLSGMLDNDRVTLVGDGVNIVVRNNIIYKNYSDNPDFRLPENKDIEATVDNILGDEMLGVVSRARMTNTANQPTSTTGRIGGGDINMAYRYWQHLGLSPSEYGGHSLGKVSTGAINQYCMDGVFMGTHSCGDNYFHSTSRAELNSEVWFLGGLIAERCTYYCENAWRLVHYDWDYRLSRTTPPFFLVSYNVNARFVPGTWRSWSE